MIKNIMLKMLMRVITTGLAVTGGIAGPAAVSSCQNTADISVIVEEDVRTAETIADTMLNLEETYTSEKASVAQGNTTKQESRIPDRQSADTAASADAQRSADEQKSADVQQTGNVQKTADTTNTTQPETKTETADAVTQPETVVPTEEAAGEAAEEENHVVTSNVAVAEITIYFPPAVKEEPDPVEPAPAEPAPEEPTPEEPAPEEPSPEEPVYMEIHDCNCGWSTTDYNELKMHMYNHVIKGEAHSYTTVVVKK